MNKIQREMVDVLKCLKEEYGVYEIKAEFEAEASRLEEMMRLKDVTEKVDLPIILKIGGVEAITDIYNAMTIGVKGIIAPMAETAFAVSKFIGAIDAYVPEDNAEDIDFAINIETITACENLDSILELPGIDKLYGVTIGRVDLVGSMGMDRSLINSEEIYTVCENVFHKVKSKGLHAGLGGSISPSSIEFIKRLANQKLIEKFETRKVVYSVDSLNGNIEQGMQKGIEFELLWLKSKQRYYSRIKLEDQARIDMLQKRLG
jgi:4-hydroxy-2-oxoheptanedioate aldolase